MSWQSGHTPFLFFAGIDGVAPIVREARRDQQLISQHRTHFWRTDFTNVRRLHLDTLRWGPNWYQVNPERDRYDWSHVDDRLAYAQENGLDIWYVLQHKQVPDWTEILDPDFPRALRAYGEQVALRYPHLRTFCISVEPEFYALIACRWGHWQPHRKRAFDLALDNFAAAISETADAIHRIRPDAQIVHMDFAPGIRLAQMVAPHVDAMALDYYLCHHEHDISGWINYWWDHLRMPLYIGETGLAGGYCNHDIHAQQEYIRSTMRACRAAITRGIDMRGLCFYPTVTDNFYWGSNQTVEYECRYPPGVDTHIGDNAGGFFRFRVDQDGLYRREPVPALVRTFWREMRAWRAWESGADIHEHALVA